MKTLKKLFFILLAISAVSCGNSHKGITVKTPNFSNGKAGEIIVVADEPYWTTMQEYVTISLTQPQPAINQIEPLFDILQFSYKDFSKQFQRHRNIVHFDVNPNYVENQYYIETDKWSAPQVYVRIKSFDADSCLALFKKHEEEMVKALYDNDLKRNQAFYAKNVEAGIQKRIKQKFGLRLTVPNTYIIASDTADFMWLRFRTARNDRFIMIYRLPATELTRANLINQRNEITKAHIPGAVLGAYPIVAETLGFPISDSLTINGKEGVEMRGLWECVNDKMGGPFYSFSYLSPDNQYVITIDGFVYAPEETKRDYLREVESIVKSVK